MKNPVLIAILFLQLVAVFAKAEDNTRISIKPSWSVNCLLKDYSLLNEVGEVEKLEETETQATFRFVTRLIRCESFTRTAYELIPELLRVSIGSSKIELALRTPSELVVTATFDKVKIFKLNKSAKSQRFEHKTQFIFHPYGYPNLQPRRWGEAPPILVHPLQGYSFWWNVRLSRDQANTTQIELARKIIP